MFSIYLSANPLESHYVAVVELPEVVDAGLRLLLDLFDGHKFALPLALEDGALGTAAQPTELGDRLKRDLPVI